MAQLVESAVLGWRQFIVVKPTLIVPRGFGLQEPPKLAYGTA
jgi:hypothetical protein